MAHACKTHRGTLCSGRGIVLFDSRDTLGFNQPETPKINELAWVSPVLTDAFCVNAGLTSARGRNIMNS